MSNIRQSAKKAERILLNWREVTKFSPINSLYTQEWLTFMFGLLLIL